MASPEKMERFFKKNHILEENIKYIIRQDSKTCLYLFNGKVVKTYIPAKTIITSLGNSHFININKGVYINSRYVIDIKGNNYTMIDNKCFEGRSRLSGDQKTFNDEWQTNINKADLENPVLSHLHILDDCPIGFSVIEIVFNEQGNGVDFFFRYCNKQMVQIEELPLDQLIDHSFLELFPDDNLTWVASYADVAINNTQKVIHSYSNTLKKYLSVYCFQLKPRFCGCIVFDSENTIREILSHDYPFAPSHFDFLKQYVK